MTPLSKTIPRVALVALALLMAPLVASRVVDGWNWPAQAFVLTYILFFGTGMAYALIARRMRSWAYQAGVGLALVTGFVMGWGTMVRTSESENPANLLYFGVLAVGGAGAWLARLEARGMARALFAMAAALAVLGVMAGSLSLAGNAINHVVFVTLFTVSGLLFRKASHGIAPLADGAFS